MGLGDLFTAAKNDAFVGAGSSVWCGICLLQLQGVGCGKGGEAEWRLLMVPRVYPKTQMVKRPSLPVWGPVRKEKSAKFDR